MELTKPTLPDGVTSVNTLEDMIANFQVDKIYISKGAYADIAAVKAAFADLTGMASELSTSYVELGEIASSACSIESKSELFEGFKHKTLEKSRSTTVTVKCGGMDSAKKDWIEAISESSDEYTVVCVNPAGNSIVVFNGFSWAADWKAEDEDGVYFDMKSSTRSKTTDKVVLIAGIEAAA